MTSLILLLLYCLLQQQRHSDCGVSLRSLRSSFQTLLDIHKFKLTEGDAFAAAAAAAEAPQVGIEDLKSMIDSLASMRVVEAFLHLPLTEPPLAAAAAEKKRKPGVHTPGSSSRAATVDPIIDEAGGDTEVAIIAPIDDLVAAFLRDEDLEGLPF
ncbi:hypothetical protein, conserved [Eimeria tenella]|uniref:Uncharacterized protein n=1 Tax=Eimeria tenella TaxID=5802 RepID=U6LAC4_EIMTE|nr:hypothetical protein, conserved [Eimeria tenella]CDJ45484.1 hypothetical protein, conserved [Eimeria tenella]|eukprot:XP_013236230.1 hypothetical protein, conserved [Eimeria tenella]